MDRAKLDTIIAPLPIDDLREQFSRAEPFPFVKIDNFLVRQFADKVAASYPTFDDALRRGFGPQMRGRKIHIDHAGIKQKAQRRFLRHGLG